MTQRLKNRIVSSQLAQELKQAGFEQLTGHYYNIAKTPENIIKEKYGNYNLAGVEAFEHYTITYESFAAPTAEELLEELPAYIEKQGRLTIWKYEVRYHIAYDSINKQFYDLCIEDKCLANALAMLWIKLKKKNLLK